MIVVMLCCYLRRYVQVCDGMLRNALQWLHENVAWALFWGGSRSTKPCIFPCKVAAGGDERYLLCAAGAAAVVPDALGSSSVFCIESLCLCA